MFKILVLDRCSFTRTGMEYWLKQTDLFSTSFLVTGLHNLMLAKEHIVRWQPDLVIADLYGFKNEIHHLQQLTSLFSVCPQGSQVLLLESGEDAPLSSFYTQLNIQTTLLKTVTLKMLAHTIDRLMLARPQQKGSKIVTPLLTRQEEKVLTLWMEENTNQSIASKLCINGKTVYTYKRNIRMKLGMGNRFTPFLSLPDSTS